MDFTFDTPLEVEINGFIYRFLKGKIDEYDTHARLYLRCGGKGPDGKRCTGVLYWTKFWNDETNTVDETKEPGTKGHNHTCTPGLPHNRQPGSKAPTPMMLYWDERMAHYNGDPADIPFELHREINIDWNAFTPADRQVY